ncbi:unnamed protein product [Caretta caretta]
MRSNQEWRNPWASTRTKVNIETSSGWWSHQTSTKEDVRGGRALLGPRAVPLPEGSIKVPAQDQALTRIQGAEEGGRLLKEMQPLQARCRGIEVDKIDHEPLHMDPEVQQAARHSLGDPQHLGS